MNWKAVLTLIAVFAACLPGCTSSLTGDTYTRQEARTAQNVEYGTIQSIRSVMIEGTSSGVGAVTGGLLGGIAGSNIGGGRGRYAATVAGAAAGGVAGNAAERAVTKKQGIEIEVKMDSGGLRAVVQEVSPNETFSVGDRVRVLTHGGTMRVTY